MNRFLIPTILVVGVIILLTLQCTQLWDWRPWGVALELLPPLLLYAAFTVNLPTAVLIGSLAALMYDSYSGGHFGATLIPYLICIYLFCMLRPIFFRNRLTTQLLSGMGFGFLALTLQWIFSGKVSIGVGVAMPHILKMSVACGVLAILYFQSLDLLYRLMGHNPGRFEDSIS
jgi:cell shape-determining protein MreD